jgi:hypothetical protein
MAHFTDAIVYVGDQVQNNLEKWRIGTSSKRIVIYPGIPIGKKGINTWLDLNLELICQN